MIQEYIENISSGDIDKLIKKHYANKVFLVTGKKSFKLSGAESFVKESLKNTEFVRFFEFEQNPKYEESLRGAKLFKETNCDLILAIGGGSAMDIAKLINVFSSNSHLDGFEIIKKPSLIANKGVPLIAIPTTAGTGSEATHFAAVYHNNKKYSLAHKNVLPNIAGLNYKFTLSQSSYLTACSGLDALSQAIESYWSVGATKESKSYARKAIAILVKHLESCVLAPNDVNREAVVKAAYFAGRAINISKTTAAHAISYAYTTYFSIPHGHAVFLTLPKFFIVNSKVTHLNINGSKNVQYVLDTISELCDLLNVDSPLKAQNLLVNLANKIGVETSFRKLGITKQADVDLIFNNINIERLSNNPISICPDLLRTLLKD